MQNNGTTPIMPSEGLVRLPVVLKVLGIGKTTWWCGIKTGRFPKPVKIGPRMSAWRVEDIRTLISSFSEGSPDGQ